MNALVPDARALHAAGKRVRSTILRLAGTQSVHLGSSLSVADILLAAGREIGLTPDTAGDRRRDRLILSKGHAVWAFYAVLAELNVLDLDSRTTWPGHPTDGIAGIDVATGALGHGLSIGAGLAEASRLRGWDRRVFVVLGDGELNEGSVWEAVMFAAHRRLDRLVAIVDLNGLQQEGPTAEVLDLGSLRDKWEAFGWRVVDVDGHDHADLAAALAATAERAQRPTVLLARTVKGRGVPFMEHNLAWHFGALDGAQLTAALTALDAVVVNHG